MQNTKFRFFFPLLFLFIAVHQLNFAQTVNLKFIETSDVHGAILPYDLIKDTTTNFSLAQVYTYIENERNKTGQQVIFLDNGDILQGDPLVYFYNYEDTTGTHIYADAMNFMQYDAGTVGNHDIETGHDVYDKFNKELKFPWLAANAVDTETGEPYFKPYTIIEKKGIKIAVFGMITPAIPNWLPENLWEGIRFDDMIETAEKWVPIIKEKEKPDLLIGLFHSGVNYNYNYENEKTYRNENASQLVAERVPGFDVVFVGHDHAGWNFKVANVNGDSVLINGTVSKAKTIAVADIVMEYNKNAKNWEKKNVTGKILETKDYQPDEMFMNKFTQQLNVVKNYVNKPLGQILKTISSKESLFGPSEFVDLINTAQLEISGADISLTSPLSMNITIDSGWVYVKDMFSLYRYENFLYTMKLSGSEIKNYLEYSYGKWFNRMKDEDDHLLKFAKDENGEIKYSKRYGVPETENVYYNFSSAAGIKYTVDVSKPEGVRISIESLSNGTPFDLNKTYTVAINSYRGNGGGGHITRGAGIPKEKIPERILTSTDKDIRFYIMKWIEEKKTINPTVIGNWKIIPEEWWIKGKEKDYELLFGDSPVGNN